MPFDGVKVLFNKTKTNVSIKRLYIENVSVYPQSGVKYSITDDSSYWASGQGGIISGYCQLYGLPTQPPSQQWSYYSAGVAVLLEAGIGNKKIRLKASSYPDTSKLTGLQAYFYQGKSPDSFDRANTGRPILSANIDDEGYYTIELSTVNEIDFGQPCYFGFGQTLWYIPPWVVSNTETFSNNITELIIQ